MPTDRDLILEAAEDMEILGRCLTVEAHLQRWEAGDAVSGGIAADGLDQARGLLEDLQGGRAAELLAAIERIAAKLPPPFE